MSLTNLPLVRSTVSFFSKLFLVVPKEQKNAAPLQAWKNQQQDELSILCKKLFKQEGLVLSGRLQILGLQKVKKRMGGRWESVKKRVYETIDAVIRENIRKGDLYLRYNETLYLIIFSGTDRDKNLLRIKNISQEAQKRIFSMKIAGLEDLSIQENLCTVLSAQAQNLQAQSLLDFFAQPPQPPLPASVEQNKEMLPSVKPVFVEAQPIETPPIAMPLSESHSLPVTFMPIWDVRKSALSMYLCLPIPQTKEETPLAGYNRLMDAAPYSARVEMDLALVFAARQVMEKIMKEDYKPFVVCPVHYDTLYRQESFDRYIVACQSILTMTGEKLFFPLIAGLPENLPVKDAFWFIPSLKNRLFPAVFAEILLENISTMSRLKGTGIDVVGCSPRGKRTETAFAANSKIFVESCTANGIQRSFLFDIASPEFARIAIEAGFNYLGGNAVHENVVVPRNVYHYTEENLVASFGPEP